jgi:hypothetical protein
MSNVGPGFAVRSELPLADDDTEPPGTWSDAEAAVLRIPSSALGRWQWELTIRPEEENGMRLKTDWS